MILNYDQYLITEKFGDVNISEIEQCLNKLSTSESFIKFCEKLKKICDLSILRKYLIDEDTINVDKIIMDISSTNEKVDVYKWFRKKEDFSDIDPLHEEDWENFRKANKFFDILNSILNFPQNFWTYFRYIDWTDVAFFSLLGMVASLMIFLIFILSTQSKRLYGPKNGTIISTKYDPPHLVDVSKTLILKGKNYKIKTKVKEFGKYRMKVLGDNGQIMYKYSLDDPNVKSGDRIRSRRYYDDIEKTKELEK